MSADRPELPLSAVVLPDAMIEGPARAPGVDRHVELARNRFEPRPLTLEQRCDLALELEQLLRGRPLPSWVEAQLLDYSAGLVGPLVVVRITGGEWEVIRAPGRAALFDAVVTAASRALCPVDTRGPLRQAGTNSPRPVDDRVAICSERTLPPEFRRWIGRRAVVHPFRAAEVLILEPQSMQEAADASSNRDEAAALWALASYAAASSPGARGALWASALTAARAAFRRATDTHHQPSAVEPIDHPSARAIGVQQLTGSPAAPGRTEGQAWWTAWNRENGAGNPRPHEAPIVICDRFDELLLSSTRPAAVVERLGGCLGIGAAIAREAGIPCVSGVADAALLEEGSLLRVDGDLGLITLLEVDKD